MRHRHIDNSIATRTVDAMRAGKQGIQVFDTWYSFDSVNDLKHIGDSIHIAIRQHANGIYCGILTLSTLHEFKGYIQRMIIDKS